MVSIEIVYAALFSRDSLLSFLIIFYYTNFDIDRTSNSRRMGSERNLEPTHMENPAAANGTNAPYWVRSVNYPDKDIICTLDYEHNQLKIHITDAQPIRLQICQEDTSTTLGKVASFHEVPIRCFDA